MLKNTTRSYSRKKEAEINDLIQTIRNLQLSLPDHGRIPSRSRSRSRVIDNTATPSPRKTRSKSRARARNA